MTPQSATDWPIGPACGSLLGGEIGLEALCLHNLIVQRVPWCNLGITLLTQSDGDIYSICWQVQRLVLCIRSSYSTQWVFFPLKRGRKAVQKHPNQAARENSTHGLTGRSTNSKQTEHGFQCLDPVALFRLILTECLTYFVVDGQCRVMQESRKRYYRQRDFFLAVQKTKLSTHLIETSKFF